MRSQQFSRIRVPEPQLLIVTYGRDGLALGQEGKTANVTVLDAGQRESFIAFENGRSKTIARLEEALHWTFVIHSGNNPRCDRRLDRPTSVVRIFARRKASAEGRQASFDLINAIPTYGNLARVIAKGDRAFPDTSDSWPLFWHQSMIIPWFPWLERLSIAAGVSGFAILGAVKLGALGLPLGALVGLIVGRWAVNLPLMLWASWLVKRR